MSRFIWFGLSGFFLLFCLLFYFRNAPIRPNVGTPEHIETHTPPSSTHPPLAPQSSNVTNIENFRIHTMTDANHLAFQLDARQPFEKQTVFVAGSNPGGYDLQITASGETCTGGTDPCSDPDGEFGPAEFDKQNSKNFPVGSARYYSLIGRFGNGPGFGIGSKGTVHVPPNTRFQMMANLIVQPSGNCCLAQATGGFRGEITISPQ